MTNVVCKLKKDRYVLTLETELKEKENRLKGRSDDEQNQKRKKVLESMNQVTTR